MKLAEVKKIVKNLEKRVKESSNMAKLVVCDMLEELGFEVRNGSDFKFANIGDFDGKISKELLGLKRNTSKYRQTKIEKVNPSILKIKELDEKLVLELVVITSFEEYKDRECTILQKNETRDIVLDTFEIKTEKNETSLFSEYEEGVREIFIKMYALKKKLLDKVGTDDKIVVLKEMIKYGFEHYDAGKLCWYFFEEDCCERMFTGLEKFALDAVKEIVALATMQQLYNKKIDSDIIYVLTGLKELYQAQIERLDDITMEKIDIILCMYQEEKEWLFEDMEDDKELFDYYMDIASHMNLELYFDNYGTISVRDRFEQLEGQLTLEDAPVIEEKEESIEKEIKMIEEFRNKNKFDYEMIRRAVLQDADIEWLLKEQCKSKQCLEVFNIMRKQMKENKNLNMYSDDMKFLSEDIMIQICKIRPEELGETIKKYVEEDSDIYFQRLIYISKEMFSRCEHKKFFSIEEVMFELLAELHNESNWLTLNKEGMEKVNEDILAEIDYEGHITTKQRLEKIRYCGKIFRCTTFDIKQEWLSFIENNKTIYESVDQSWSVFVENILGKKHNHKDSTFLVCEEVEVGDKIKYMDYKTGEFKVGEIDDVICYTIPRDGQSIFLKINGEEHITTCYVEKIKENIDINTPVYDIIEDTTEVNTDGINKQKKDIVKLMFEDMKLPETKKITLEDGNILISEGFKIEGKRITYEYEHKMLHDDTVDFHLGNVIVSEKLRWLYNQLKDRYDLDLDVHNIVDSTNATRTGTFSFKREECTEYKCIKQIEIKKEKESIYKLEEVITDGYGYEEYKNKDKEVDEVLDRTSERKMQFSQLFEQYSSDLEKEPRDLSIEEIDGFVDKYILGKYSRTTARVIKAVFVNILKEKYCIEYSRELLVEETKININGIYSEEEIKIIVEQFINAQDQFIVYSLFKGIAGSKAEELLKITKKDIDFNSGRLKLNGKFIDLDDYHLKLAHDAMKEKEYYKYTFNGNGAPKDHFDLNEECEYVIKPKPTVKNNKGKDAFGYEGLRRRLQMLGKYTDTRLSIDTLKRSGLVDDLYKEGKTSYLQIEKYLKDNKIKGTPDLLYQVIKEKYKEHN